MAQPLIRLIDVGTKVDEALLVLKVSDLCECGQRGDDYISCAMCEWRPSSFESCPSTVDADERFLLQSNYSPAYCVNSHFENVWTLQSSSCPASLDAKPHYWPTASAVAISRCLFSPFLVSARIFPCCQANKSCMTFKKLLPHTNTHFYKSCKK